MRRGHVANIESNVEAIVMAFYADCSIDCLEGVANVSPIDGHDAAAGREVCSLAAACGIYSNHRDMMATQTLSNPIDVTWIVRVAGLKGDTMGIQTKAMTGRLYRRLTAQAKLGDGNFLQTLLDALGEDFFDDLFALFLNNLIACERPADGKDAQETAQRHYKRNGRYRRRVFARASRLVRQTASDEGMDITRRQGHGFTQVLLDEFREGDQSSMSLVIAEQRRRA